ncbi:ISNCY family transposase [Patescibacteria group bacterium]|nr:ISNCY family transposase [Patescibacteria group bacterium]
MSKKELNRLPVIESVIQRKLTQIEAANRLGLSDRQIRRIAINFSKLGPAGLIHHLRGRPSNHRLPSELKDRAVNLIREKYFDFGPTLAAEKLEEINGIKIGRNVLRTEMIKADLWQAKKRKPKHRAWRERKDHFGELAQFDGSHHNWFEDRGEKAVLLASRDDANNYVFACFYHFEGTMPVFDFWQRYIKSLGKPKAIYLDSHGTYKINHKIALDEKTLTQFGRACEELNIELINARSPQAKGRIENLFGTLQDRLAKELRLKGISAIKEANAFLQEEFLPKFNQRFQKQAKKKADFHQPLTVKDNLAKSFSIKSERLINNDFTISFKNHWYQLEARQPKLILPRSKVIIEERLDDNLIIEQDDKCLNFKEINKEKTKPISKPRIFALTSNHNQHYPQMARVPVANHPWRRYQPSALTLTR